MVYLYRAPIDFRADYFEAATTPRPTLAPVAATARGYALLFRQGWLESRFGSGFATLSLMPVPNVKPAASNVMPH